MVGQKKISSPLNQKNHALERSLELSVHLLSLPFPAPSSRTSGLWRRLNSYKTKQSLPVPCVFPRTSVIGSIPQHPFSSK